MALGAAKQDSGGRNLYGPFDPASMGGRAWRAANVDADLADGRVVLYDHVGNPVFWVTDLDTGAGTAYRPGVALLVPASGGPAVVPGDGTNGLKTQIASAITLTTVLEHSASSIARPEDTPSANGDAGASVMFIRKATPANLSSTDGDYEMFQGSAGRLWVSAVVDTALPAGTNAIGKLAANSGVDIGDVDVTSLPYTAAMTPGYSQPSVTSTSGTVLAANGSRKYALFQNIGVVDVFLRFGGAAAVANQGVLLQANGGAYETSGAFGNLLVGAVTGITATGSATVLVSELT